MPNGTYGGVRGKETKVDQKTFVSRPTRFASDNVFGLNAYFAFYSALPSFRLARANYRLVVTNHCLVGANHRLAGANNELSKCHRLQLHTADVKSYASASQ